MDKQIALTPELKAQYQQINDKWFGYCASTSPVDRQALEVAVKDYYISCKLAPPVIAICGSPESMTATAVVLALPQLESALLSRLPQAMRDDVVLHLDRLRCATPLNWSESNKLSVENALQSFRTIERRFSYEDRKQLCAKDYREIDPGRSTIFKSAFDEVNKLHHRELAQRGLATAIRHLATTVTTLTDAEIAKAVKRSTKKSDKRRAQARVLARQLECDTTILRRGPVAGYANDWANSEFAELILPMDKSFNKARLIRQIGANCHALQLFEGVALFSERPQVLKLNTDGQLHCFTGPALVYSDGLQIEYFQGKEVQAAYQPRT